MPQFNTNQWIVVALVFLLGWFVGMFMLAGGRKWRAAFEQERAARGTAEREVERLNARIAELEVERERHRRVERLDGDGRRVDLEQDRARRAALDRGDAVTNPDAGAFRRDRVDREIGAASQAGAIAAAASGRRDDLSLIYGVGRPGEMKLNDLGIHRYTDIISMSLGQERDLENRLGLAQGTIAEERWRDQAEMLRKGNFDEHARVFA